MPAECCGQHEAMVVIAKTLKEDIAKYNANQSDIVKGQHELRERTAVIERDVEALHTRMDKTEAQTDAIIRLSISVESMSKEVQEVITLFKDHDDRIVTLEQRPNTQIANRWNKIVEVAISAIVGGTIATILF